MTSKEALTLAILEYEKDLETDENNQWIKDVLKGLKECQQDLEVLEILKRSIFNKEIHKYTLDEKYKGQKFMIIGLIIREEDNINKINEWLENGKRETDRNL